MIVFALSVAVAVGAAWTLIFWPNPNSKTFLDFSASIVLLSIGATFLVGWAVLYRRLPGADWPRWCLLVIAVAFTVFGIRSAIHAGPPAAYTSRGFCVAVVAVLQGVLWADWIRIRHTESRDDDRVGDSVTLSTGALRGAAAFLVVVLIIPTTCAVRWSTVVRDFRSTITERTGDVPATDVRTGLARTYLLPWTNTTLSVVLRSSSSNAVVENTTDKVHPFSIDVAEQQVPPAYRWGK
jgi:hypothetical protein